MKPRKRQRKKNAKKTRQTEIHAMLAELKAYHRPLPQRSRLRFATNLDPAPMPTPGQVRKSLGLKP